MTGPSAWLDPDPVRKEVELVNRLEHLEREYRRLKRYTASLLIGVAILLGLAVAFTIVSSRYGLPGTVAELVSAKKFILRDQEGAVRGLWGTASDGSIRFVLQDAKGRPRAKLNLLSDGSTGLSLADTTGYPHAVFALLPDNSGSLAFADRAGLTRSVFGVSPDGSATLVFVDRKGATRASLGVDGQGGGAFQLLDRQGRPILAENEPASDSIPSSSPAGEAPRTVTPARKQ
jgi:hypothetical protein